MKYQSKIPKVVRDFQSNQITALEAVGVFVVGETQVRTPVDTGRLKGSYTHRVNRGQKSVDIGTNVEYGPFVELGTRKMRAQPHLRPAAEDNVERIKKLINIHLGKGLR